MAGFGDDALDFARQRVVVGAQALEVAVGKVRALERGVDFDKRGADCVEPLARGVLRARCPERGKPNQNREKSEKNSAKARQSVHPS